MAKAKAVLCSDFARLSAGGKWIRTSGSARGERSVPRFRFAPDLIATDGSRDDRRLQPLPAIFALSRACIARGTGSSNPTLGSLGLSKNARDSAILSDQINEFCPRFCPRRKAIKRPWMVRTRRARATIHPSEIISEHRATSNRIGGRHHPGFAGDFARTQQW